MGCLACVGKFVVCRLSKYFSAVHSVIRILFKLLLKFRNVLKHTESRSSLACNQNIKEDIPKVLEVFLCFETKRNDIHVKRSFTKTFTHRTSNFRGLTGYNV